MNELYICTKYTIDTQQTILIFQTLYKTNYANQINLN